MHILHHLHVGDIIPLLEIGVGDLFTIYLIAVTISNLNCDFSTACKL